jgi:hypothetical protein
MKNIIYQGHKEEYFCFTTSEAANAIQTYFQYRQRYDEKLTPESFVCTADKHKLLSATTRR